MGKVYTNESRAFRDKTSTAIDNCIKKLCSRVKRTVKEPVVSYREMLNLIAPSDHIELLLTARKIADIGRYVSRESQEIVTGRYDGRGAAVVFRVSGDDNSPVMPRPMGKSLWLNHYPENRHLAVEIERCVEHHAQISIEWGMVKAVFKYLDRVCKTPLQMRYLWPSIVGIMSVDEENLGDWRRELSPLRIPSKLPTLPPEVRALLRQTSQFVSMALLLPPLEDYAVETRQVEMEFKVGSGGNEVVEDLWVYPMLS